MEDPIIILAPPRSFTSLVSSMLGQHPQLYGFPELNLFVADTMGEWRGWVERLRFLEHGLLRAVGQVFAGEQTVRTVAFARRWVEERRDRTCASVFAELADAVAPGIAVDKSITTIVNTDNLRRVRSTFPSARYIHLLRHPRSMGESLRRFWGPAAVQYMAALTTPPTMDFQRLWYDMHMNVVTFLEDLPPDQAVRIRGEDLLADPDRHFRQILKWLSLRFDEEAIDEMKHPERSPYARLGPLGARFGNDPGFLRSPTLRPRSLSEAASLEGPLSWLDPGQGFSSEVVALARTFGYR